MASKITTDCIESYIKCKTKAHLKALGEQGVNSEYELLLAEIKRQIKRTMIDRILSRHEEDAVSRDLSVTGTNLGEGAMFIVGATIEDDTFSLAFDGLKKAPGESRLGKFYYVPVLFHPGEKVRLDERLLLAVQGTVLGDLQGRWPEAAIVYLGPGCRGTRVQLNDHMRKRARRIL